MKKYIVIALLMVLGTAYPAYARWSVGTAGGGVAAGGECTSPATNTVLLGVSTEATTSDQPLENNKEYFFLAPFTATWAETCTTSTMSTMQVWMSGWEGGACKALIGTSTGTLLSGGVSEPTAVEYDENPEWYTFTFNSPPTLTKDTTYRLGITCYLEAGSTIANFKYDTGTLTLGSDNTGTYGTPSAMATHDSTYDESATGGIRGRR